MLSKCTEVVSTFYPVLQQETAGLPIIGLCDSQCGKFSIFLSLRFYVKSILENVYKLKKCYFVIWVNFSLHNMQKFMKFNSEPLNVWQFLGITEIDFTENQGGMKFLHFEMIRILNLLIFALFECRNLPNSEATIRW